MPDGQAASISTVDRQHRANPEIEYLRAAAILLVIVMHAPLLCVPYPAGWLQRLQDWIHPSVGVDIFFVISGYLIGCSFVGPYEGHECGRERVARIGAFWVRRVYRLAPASFLWVGLIFLGSVVFEDPGLWLPPHAMFFKCLASLLSVRNFEESFALSDFGYYWSLSLENQFYLLLPILLLIVPRAWRVPGLVGLCVLNAVWRPGGETWWLFRYDGLVYGLLLFEMERAGYSDILAECLPTSLRGRVCLMVAAMVALVVTPLVLIHFHPLAWTMVNWAGSVLVFAASLNQGKIVVPRPLRALGLWVGSRSYSIYLSHIPVWFTIIEVMKRIGLGGPALVPLRFALALVLCAVAADLTYRRVELPLQKRGRARAKRLEAMGAALPAAREPSLVPLH